MDKPKTLALPDAIRALQAAIHAESIHHKTGDACRTCCVLLACPAFYNSSERALCELDDLSAGIDPSRVHGDSWLSDLHEPTRPISSEWRNLFE